MLSVAVGAEAVRVPVALQRVRRLAQSVLRAEGVRDALISIAFVTPRTIARLNRRHLGHAGPTDVIAFGFAPPGARRAGRRGTGQSGGLIGDVYIAPSVARRNAARWGVGIREEVSRLVVHGVLHVIGYDHPDADRTASPMWERQESLLRRLRTRPAPEKGERRKEKGDKRRKRDAR
jgi:probable rRNA maturation factor